MFQKYLHTPPLWLQNRYPDFVWKKSTNEKELFLTFDDGPIPEVTEFVLEELKKYQAKATFFCVGENLRKYPEIAKQTVANGHVLGNHTFNHLKGWRTSKQMYLENILKCEEQLEKFQQRQLLFRPPYGKLTRVQAAALSNYKIVMWNRLAWDFGKNLNTEKAIHYLCDAPQGSIVVFHDNQKSFENMRIILPRVLEHYDGEGYKFRALR